MSISQIVDTKNIVISVEDTGRYAGGSILVAIDGSGDGFIYLLVNFPRKEEPIYYWINTIGMSVNKGSTGRAFAFRRDAVEYALRKNHWEVFAISDLSEIKKILEMH